jgi:8-oxo-dGTP pyrophosphatase MutT (NUDIX family)
MSIPVSVPPPAVPRPSATLVLVRPATPGFEILLLQRADKGDHNSNAWVFPGGLVDAGDAQCHVCCGGLDDAAASARLGLPQGGLDFYIGAMRECFEEAGVMLAGDAQGRPAVADAALAAWREPLRRGERDFASACRAHGLTLTADRLAYLAHWVTPVGLPKRFDTRFFLAVLPAGQDSTHDAVETIDHVWLPPAQILAPENARRMLKVTRTIVEMLAGFADLQALLQWAHTPRDVPRVMQRRCTEGGGLRTVMPQHPAYAEIGLLDAAGEGTAWCELRPGVAVRLLPRVQRLTRRDARTGANVNAYLVGDPASGWAMVEPGADGVPVVTGARLLQPLHDPEHPSLLLGWLLAEEGVLFPRNAAVTPAGLAPAVRAAVRWIAPVNGFLLPAQ